MWRDNIAALLLILGMLVFMVGGVAACMGFGTLGIALGFGMMFGAICIV